MNYNVFQNNDLNIAPIQRAAYSDRTALIMGELSLLAYLKHEDLKEKNILENHLKQGGYDLLECYNEQGTQAFLATQSIIRGGKEIPGMIVLSFRGTEPTKLPDLAADLRAGTVEVDGIQVHRGFLQAFEYVKDKIWKDLKPKLDEGYTLYITGHSLGGALALFATRSIGNDSTGACYTFGSPRVAGFGFDKSIKTPIYRVINSYDAVPTLPPEIIPFILYKIFSFLNVSTESWLMKKLDSVHGYIHHGDMRYITQGKDEDSLGYDDVELYKNPSDLYRLLWWWKGMREYKKGAYENHSIELYCAKLRSYAHKRN